MVYEEARGEKAQELLKHRTESRDIFFIFSKHEAVLFERTHKILFTTFDCSIFGLFQAKQMISNCLPYLCSTHMVTHSMNNSSKGICRFSFA